MSYKEVWICRVFSLAVGVCEMSPRSRVEKCWRNMGHFCMSMTQAYRKRDLDHYEQSILCTTAKLARCFSVNMQSSNLFFSLSFYIYMFNCFLNCNLLSATFVYRRTNSPSPTSSLS